MIESDLRFIVADTETTGVDPEAKAVEVGWIEIDENFNILNQVESLLDPEHPISPSASGVHGLVNDDLMDSPTIEEFFSLDAPGCYGKPLDGNVVLIGHRIGFDVRFLGKFIPNLVQELDTLRWVRKLYPDIDDHKLSTLIFALGLPRSAGAHRVMADVVSAFHLCRHICERTGMSLSQLAAASREPMILQRMPIGKHKGMPMRDVPKGWLRWAVDNMKDLDIDLKHNFKLALSAR